MLFQAADLTDYETKSYSPEMSHFLLESRECRSTPSIHSTPGWHWSVCAQSHSLQSPLEELVRKEEDSLRFPRLIVWEINTRRTPTAHLWLQCVQPHCSGCFQTQQRGWNCIWLRSRVHWPCVSLVSGLQNQKHWSVLGWSWVCRPGCRPLFPTPAL